MLNEFKISKTSIQQTNIKFSQAINYCQADYPLDWYQKEFIPYAEEYQQLPDRKLSTIIPWMRRYIQPAINALGNDLLLVAHYYMGGDIVKLMQEFGGTMGDSYQLALAALENPQKKIIVESAVHFMAETIAILANDDQAVYITNPKSGCTMEMFAKDFMVKPALSALNERYDEKNILPVCYMNTSGRVKALTGAQNGAICTSSNVKKIFQWALRQNKKILFIPDKNMGENVADWVGIKPENIAYWPGGQDAMQYILQEQNKKTLQRFDDAQLILFSSLCTVHDYYKPEMIAYWKKRDYAVIAHPECHRNVVSQSDHAGSTAFIWHHAMNDLSKSKKYAIATEDHFVQNLKACCQPLNIDVVNLGDADIKNRASKGCACATMSRNDPPHLVGLLDLIRKGDPPSFNCVKPGDVVHEFTGTRTRLDESGQAWIRDNARVALENMIRITRQ